MSSISKKLTIAVLLSCSGFLPYQALAKEPTPPHQSNPWEVKLKDTNGKDRTFAIFDVYDKTNDPGDTYRDVSSKEKKAFVKGLQYISDMVGFPTEENIPCIKLEFMSQADDNAAAISEPAIHPDTRQCITNTKLAECIQSNKQITDLDENEYIAEIEIHVPKSKSYEPEITRKWYMDDFSILPNNGVDGDYYGTITHELCHALGLAAYHTKREDGTFVIGTAYQFPSKEGTPAKEAIIFTPFELGIRDVFGRVPYYGKDEKDNPIYFDTHPEDVYSFSGLLGSRTIEKIEKDTYQSLLKDPTQLKPDTFYVLNSQFSDANCGAYFTGNHVKEVLTTNGEEAVLTWPENKGNPPVKGGLPLNGYEGLAELLGAPELSHIELKNSLLSHQGYRNWCTFMEAEIAMLQDLGYTIDRSQYFGKSIYNSGTISSDGTISYFTYTNPKGFDSSHTQGIGLHLYGRYLDITQKGNIDAKGAYSMGIRVDGVKNKLTIDSAVQANGMGSNGLTVTYGKEHEITLQNQASLTALGKDGIAARFDFGSNELGDILGYLGSYIALANNNGYWEAADEYNLPSDIAGALVSHFNVNGTLVGEKAAIYISPNAYVQNINFMDGSVLLGDILSEWNPEKVKYQNAEPILEDKPLHPAIPNDDPYKGRTMLTFGTKADESGHSSFQLNSAKSSPNLLSKQSLQKNINKLSDKMTYVADKDFSMTYDGNISGAESLEVKALGGTLTYNGTANVYSFAIGEAGTVKGNGSYKVKNGFTNEGNFQLSQTIQDTTIDGSYTQGDTGNLIVGFNGQGKTDTLKITGEANIDGQISFAPTASYYSGNTTLTPDTVVTATQGKQGTFQEAKLVNQNCSPILQFSMSPNSDGTYTLSTSRSSNAYSQLATNSITHDIGLAFDKNASSVQGNAQELVAAIDFAGSAADVNTALSKLNPSIYGSQGQSQLQTHGLLDTLSPLGLFSSSHLSEDWTSTDNQMDSHAWHAMAMPFSSYTHQHRAGQGYKNHRTGFLGAAEHTRSNGLTLGYHGAVSHESTSDASGSVKGNAFYIGTEVHYAPDDWHGWSLFGSARLGLEQMKSRRHVTIGSYQGNAWADWTGFGGDFRIGGALTKETPSIQYGPFASLSYRFSHRPSITEKGDAIAAHLDSTTYDSLVTQLGYHFYTRPKVLDSYQGATWQLHSTLSWNHELLSDTGHTDYSLVDFPGITISDPTTNYGRDSLSLSAGLTLRTPKSWDVTFQVGSDMYRKGGSSTYGKVNVEWRF